ncbi:MAG: hypothetical protein ACAF42_02920 [Limnothrix sp. BL-A-16]
MSAMPDRPDRVGLVGCIVPNQWGEAGSAIRKWLQYNCKKM